MEKGGTQAGLGLQVRSKHSQTLQGTLGYQLHPSVCPAQRHGRGLLYTLRKSEIG